MDTYFNRSPQEALEAIGSTSGGLTTGKAEEKLKEFGPNALAEGKTKSPFVVFLEQFKDLLVVILLIAAGISFISGERGSTIVILIVLLLNAVL